METKQILVINGVEHKADGVIVLLMNNDEKTTGSMLIEGEFTLSSLAESQMAFAKGLKPHLKKALDNADPLESLLVALKMRHGLSHMLKEESGDESENCSECDEKVTISRRVL